LSGETVCSNLLILQEADFSTLESQDAELALANRGRNLSTEESAMIVPYRYLL
jgi:hypothetical protein